ncbi:MAG: hypothetical protein ACLFTV_20075, partial [Desulfococcaceae bacterium]
MKPDGNNGNFQHISGVETQSGILGWVPAGKHSLHRKPRGPRSDFPCDGLGQAADRANGWAWAPGRRIIVDLLKIPKRDDPFRLVTSQYRQKRDGFGLGFCLKIAVDVFSVGVEGGSGPDAIGVQFRQNDHAAAFQRARLGFQMTAQGPRQVVSRPLIAANARQHQNRPIAVSICPPRDGPPSRRIMGLGFAWGPGWRRSWFGNGRSAPAPQQDEPTQRRNQAMPKARAHFPRNSCESPFHAICPRKKKKKTGRNPRQKQLD